MTKREPQDALTAKIREHAHAMGYNRMLANDRREVRRDIAAQLGCTVSEVSAALRRPHRKPKPMGLSAAIRERAAELGWSEADEVRKAAIRLEVARELGASKQALYQALVAVASPGKPGRPREHPRCPTCGQSLGTAESRERAAAIETIPTTLLTDPDFVTRVKRRVGPSLWGIVRDVFAATLHALKTIDRDDPMKPTTEPKEIVNP